MAVTKGMKLIPVKVRFAGVVEVLVPISVPVGRRRPLAEKLAVSRVVASLENPDAPDDVACEEYGEEFDLPEDLAEKEWDSCTIGGVGGDWMAVTESEE